MSSSYTFDGMPLLVCMYERGVKLRVFVACILSAFAGSQIVHLYYKPDMGIPTSPTSSSAQNQVKFNEKIPQTNKS